MPIEKVVPAEIGILRRGVRQITDRIQPLQTFRVTVEKRHSTINSSDLIRGIASEIDRDVDLSNPDWIVLVEVIQNIAGLSVIRPSQVFSSVVEKRKLGDTFTL